jgi:hypothetical protein
MDDIDIDFVLLCRAVEAIRSGGEIQVDENGKKSTVVVEKIDPGRQKQGNRSPVGREFA